MYDVIYLVQVADCQYNKKYINILCGIHACRLDDSIKKDLKRDRMKVCGLHSFVSG